MGVGNRGWRIRFWVPFSAKPYWSAGNQWKSRFSKSGDLEVSRCGEFKSECHITRNPIDQQGTDQNRIFRKSGYLKVGRWREFEFEDKKIGSYFGCPGTNQNGVGRKVLFSGDWMWTVRIQAPFLWKLIVRLRTIWNRIIQEVVFEG